MRALFYQFHKNLRLCFSRRSLWWFSVACGLTFVFTTSGFDWWYFSQLYESAVYDITFPAVIVGAVIPIFGILYFLWSSEKKRNSRRVNAGWAMGQAAILGYLFSSALKAFTGRVPPSVALANGVVDVSREFRFGFWRGGIFWGWPSSHTAIAFAMAVTLIVLYPEKKWIKYTALLYALYIGIGVSMSVHWFSEFAAGAIIGSGIGIVVGNAFKQRFVSSGIALVKKSAK